MAREGLVFRQGEAICLSIISKALLSPRRQTRTSTIDIYDYKTLKKVKTLVSSADLAEVRGFFDYSFSEDESKVLLTTNSIPVFRRSTLGEYYIYDIENEKVTKVSNDLVQEPTFSPDASKIAYGFENNLYIKDLKSGDVKQITFDGEKNKIINGISTFDKELKKVIIFCFAFNFF